MSIEKKFLPFLVYAPDISTGKKWFVYWYDGKKRIRKYGDINRFSTPEERIKAIEKIIKQYRHVKCTVQVPLTFKEKAYSKFKESRGAWRKKTYQTLVSKLNIFFKQHGKQEPTGESLKAFFVWLKNNRHKTTYNTYYQALKMCFAELGKETLFDGIQRMRTSKTPARYFQSYQVSQLKKELLLNDPELWLFVQFQYYCFIRPNSELRLLKVGDIMLDENKILIRSDISKNGKSQYVSIPEQFRNELVIFKEKNPSEYVFPSNKNPLKPKSYNYFSSKHRKVLNKLGFNRSYKLYSWKHTGAVACIKAGITVKEIQIQLRHHSLQEVDLYLRQLGVSDLKKLESKFPGI